MKKKFSKILSIGMALILSVSSVGLVKASDPKGSKSATSFIISALHFFKALDLNESKYKGFTLPKPYLLHALQFLDEREDVQNFILINSKAGDVAAMSHVCPIPNPTAKDLLMFPNAKTIIIDLGASDFPEKWENGLKELHLHKKIENIWLMSCEKLCNFPIAIEYGKVTKCISNLIIGWAACDIICDYMPRLQELIIHGRGFYSNYDLSKSLSKYIIEISKRAKVTCVFRQDLNESYWYKSENPLEDKENIELKYSKKIMLETLRQMRYQADFEFWYRIEEDYIKKLCEAYKRDKSCEYCREKTRNFYGKTKKNTEENCIGSVLKYLGFYECFK